MTPSIKYFVIEGNEIKPLSLRKHDRILARKEAYMEFAGRAVKYVEVLFGMLDKKPIITSFTGSIMYFDENGYLNQELQSEKIRLALEDVRDRSSAASQLASAKYNKKFSWEVSQAIRDKIRRDIFKLKVV